MPTHYIGRQTLLLDIRGVADAQAMQTQAARTLREQVMPRLEQLFDRLGPEGYAIQFDKLELDLGELEEAHFSEQFAEKLLSAFEKAFQIQASDHRVEVAGSAKQEVDYSADAGPEIQDKSADVQVITSDTKQLRQWFQFLEKGYLPGWNGFPEADTWEEAIWRALEAEPAQMQVLARLLQRSAVARRRLLRQFSSELLDQIWDIAGKSLFIRELLKKFQDRFFVFRDKESLWERVVARFSLTEAMEIEALAAEIRRWLHTQEATPRALEKWVEASNFTPEEKALTILLHKKAESSDIQAVKDKLPQNEPLPDESLYVSHAGIVLLHPFVSTFFGSLGLLDGKQFRDENTRERAVHLLAYLATGREDAPEYELTVAKLLCGVPFAFPIRREFALSEEEREESEKLLAAVIRHWEALKNTGAEGLREGYLRRPGKLEWKSDGVYLTVEENTLDILLGRLPWGLSVIRLPWMAEMLYVKWGM